jgi:gamma-glutamylcyclotransferase (GGCT)/AIG2-like uncharacterized protein YtfP
MVQHIFVYGSLLFSEIIEGLTSKSFKTEKAILTGFKRCKVKGCDYPAAIPDFNAEIFGKVIFNVDEKSIQMLTFFEGEQYRKTIANITVQNKPIEVVLYEWQDDYVLLENQDWDMENFRMNSLDYYVQKIIPETIQEFEYFGDGE